MIFPGGEGGAGGQAKVAVVPAPLLHHRELQHSNQSVSGLFFFSLSVFVLRAQAGGEPFKWYHPRFLFITNLITLQSARAQQYFLKAA